MNAQQGKTVAEWIAEFIVARGANRVYGLQGGHIQPIWDHLTQRKVRIVDVRDEGAGVHMAHCHAVLTGEVGVAFATAGPGVTNCVSAFANASLERVPVVLIGGCAPVPQDDLGPLQGIDHVSIMRPVTRSSRTLRTADNILRDLDKAWSTAIGDGNAPGPVYLEIPTDVLRKVVPPVSSSRNTSRRDSRDGFRPKLLKRPVRRNSSRNRDGRSSSRAEARWVTAGSSCASSMRVARFTSTPRKAAASCRGRIDRLLARCARGQ